MRGPTGRNRLNSMRSAEPGSGIRQPKPLKCDVVTCNIMQRSFPLRASVDET